MTRSNGLGACVLVKPEHDILQFQPMSIKQNMLAFHAARRKFTRHAERKTRI